ncbi:MAG: hypothetical protein ACOYMX_05055 [Burkholderiales bacterium]|jgi:hypothetical protein
MSEHFLHRFVVDTCEGACWIVLQDEQMDAVSSGERRVVEGGPRSTPWRNRLSWWYFNDVGIGLLRVEAGGDAESATPLWEGRIHDAYVGRLCSVLLM